MAGSQNYQEFELFASDLAREAGKLLLQQFLKPQEVRYKSGDRRNPVTEADTLSESYLVDAIKSRYPTHAILGEEGIAGDLEESEYLWVLDPLDGTTNFVHSYPSFAVSIGFFHQNEPVIGVVMEMPHTKLYSAIKGEGAWCEGQPISCSKIDSLEKSLLVTGFGYEHG